MKPKLFGSSGLRSVVNVGLTPILATKIGVALTTFSKATKVLVGRDTRVSGLVIEDALVSGLLSGGGNVECIGIVPTPVLAYLTMELGPDVGVMITASHNPPKYNGVKIFNNESLAYNEKNQEGIEEIIENEKFKMVDWKDIGQVSSVERDFLYIEKIQKEVELNKKWSVIVDPGCGATFRLAPTLLKKIGCKVLALNAQPDGFFPGRSPEPNLESLQILAQIVKDSEVDLGVAFDGDGDRVAFVDERGVFVDFDQVLAAYAAHVIEKNSGGIVVTNVEASMCIENMVEAHGGKVVRTKVGDVHVAEELRKSNAVFGGEPCGAWIHPQFHYCPDGTYSSILLLKALEDEDMNLSRFVSRTPQFYTLRENIACKNEAKYEFMKRVKDALISFFPSYKQISTVDGVRLSLEDSWILVRASGTEPLIRLTAEGESSKGAEEIMKKCSTIIRDIIEEIEK